MRKLIFFASLCMSLGIFSSCLETGTEEAVSALRAQDTGMQYGIFLYGEDGRYYEDCSCMANIAAENGLLAHDVYTGNDKALFYAYAPYAEDVSGEWIAFRFPGQWQIYLAKGEVSSSSPIICPAFCPVFMECERDGSKEIALDNAILKGRINIRTGEITADSVGRFILEAMGDTRTAVLPPLSCNSKPCL